jgi:hypothetical protein
MLELEADVSGAPKRHAEGRNPQRPKRPFPGHSGYRSHPGAQEDHSPWSIQHSPWSSPATGRSGGGMSGAGSRLVPHGRPLRSFVIAVLEAGDHSSQPRSFWQPAERIG